MPAKADSFTQFCEYTTLWRDYVSNPDKTVKAKDWDLFFASTNPVAGIDWGALSDNRQDRKGKPRKEREAIITNWKVIAGRFSDLLKLDQEEEDGLIKELKSIKKQILEIIKDNNGRDCEVAVNRILVTLYPERLLSIPKIDHVRKLAELLNEESPSSDWIELCFKIKRKLETLFPKTMHWDAYQLLVPKYSLLQNYNLILTGAPGTGKTYLARQLAASMIGCSEKELNDNPNFEFVQFHPSYDYTDFVEGLRPIKRPKSKQIEFERQDGIFKSFCATAAKCEIREKDKEYKTNYVFVIDEINRGEISKIFGELFFSIDPGYRSEDERIYVKTQYHNLISQSCEKDYPFTKGFYVPGNVYVIGTMNDIDRSVESMDFAFRRRFSFYEVEATDTQESILKDCADKSEAINRMNSLNNAIEKVAGLSPAYHIGAAYFKKVSLYEGDKDRWGLLWDNHIKGLLYEYLRGLPKRELNNQLNSLKKAYNQGETIAPETDTSITTQL